MVIFLTNYCFEKYPDPSLEIPQQVVIPNEVRNLVKDQPLHFIKRVTLNFSQNKKKMGNGPCDFRKTERAASPAALSEQGKNLPLP